MHSPDMLRDGGAHRRASAAASRRRSGPGARAAAGSGRGSPRIMPSLPALKRSRADFLAQRSLVEGQRRVAHELEQLLHGVGRRALRQRQRGRLVGVVDDLATARTRRTGRPARGRARRRARAPPARRGWSAARPNSSSDQPSFWVDRVAARLGDRRSSSIRRRVVVDDQRRDVGRHALQRRVGAERLQPVAGVAVAEVHLALGEQVVDAAYGSPCRSISPARSSWSIRNRSGVRPSAACLRSATWPRRGSA